MKVRLDWIIHSMPLGKQTGAAFASVPLYTKSVKDTGLAEFGRKGITMAEHEMPDLMVDRKELGPKQPFKGMDVNGPLRMTIHIVVLIETLKGVLVVHRADDDRTRQGRL